MITLLCWRSSSGKCSAVSSAGTSCDSGMCVIFLWAIFPLPRPFSFPSLTQITGPNKRYCSVQKSRAAKAWHECCCLCLRRMGPASSITELLWIHLEQIPEPGVLMRLSSAPALPYAPVLGCKGCVKPCQHPGCTWGFKLSLCHQGCWAKLCLNWNPPSFPHFVIHFGRDFCPGFCLVWSNSTVLFWLLRRS